MVVIECKSNAIKSPVEEGISQHLRNQQEDGIRDLYVYSNLLLSLAVSDAKYATTATPAKFWSVWKEKFTNAKEENAFYQNLHDLKQAELPKDFHTEVFKTRYWSTIRYFQELGKLELAVTTQDQLLYSICHPKRLLELVFRFILFDEGIKKLPDTNNIMGLPKPSNK